MWAQPSICAFIVICSYYTVYPNFQSKLSGDLSHADNNIKFNYGVKYEDQ